MNVPYLYNNPSTQSRRRELRRNLTDAERKLWGILRGKRLDGLKFFRQYGAGTYTLDFFCPQHRLAIEVDGGQHAEEAQRAHDEHRTSYLGMNEIRVLRFWNNEVLGNLDGVATRIRDALNVLSRNPSQPPLAPRGGERRGFTLLELVVVIGIFLVMTGVLLTNFRRSRQGDVVRIAALRFSTDIQRMQAAALSGGGADSGASAYGVHVQMSQPDRYVLFGDRVRCQDDAQGQQLCLANGRYDADADPAEEISGGVVQLPTDVRITNTDPVAEAIDILFQPPRGTVVIVPDVVEARVTLTHAAFDDARIVSINRISGRVDVE